jgi:polyphosphate kinase 2 (PPK2 family)
MHYYGPDAKNERYDADGCTVHDYQEAFSGIFTHTSTESAPWYVIPADRKWFARVAAAGQQS